MIFERVYGIDLGNSSVKIYSGTPGEIYTEKNIIASQGREIIAVGDEAYAMYGRQPVGIKVRSPMSSGTISELELQEIVLYTMFDRIGKSRGIGSVIYFTTPPDMSSIEKRAYYYVVNGHWLRQNRVYLVESPIAEALALGIDPDKTSGAMIVNIGSQSTSFSIIADGRILMSIRHAGNRWYNISEDGGETWQPSTSTWYDITAPACNGDLIRFTSVNQGQDKNRLLHSVPYGNSRTNVSVYVSYDEGMTWQVRKCIVPYSSAYSSLCVMPDGTIGLYVEESYAGASGYSTVFYNFSLEWLTDGNDIYNPTKIIENQIVTNVLNVYPVPATSFINIDAEQIISVKIYNSAGQIVMTKAFSGTSQVRMDITSLPDGLYLIEAVDVTGLRREGRFVK